MSLQEYKGKEKILDGQHWTFSDYRQRMATKDWRALLLNDDDRIIFKGRVTPLRIKSLGSGVVEVSKQLTDG